MKNICKKTWILKKSVLLLWHHCTEYYNPLYFPQSHLLLWVTKRFACVPPQFFVFFYYIFPLLEHNNIESPINNSLWKIHIVNKVQKRLGDYLVGHSIVTQGQNPKKEFTMVKSRIFCLKKGKHEKFFKQFINKL